MFKAIKARKNGKKARELLMQELIQILHTMDYSNSELSTWFDEENNKLIVPKPVLALTLIDDEITDWLNAQCIHYPVNIVEVV